VFSFALALSGVIAPSGYSSDKLNVLLIVADDLNTDLECYGHSLVQSPNIDRLAERGVRFENAYCQYPVCNPSRASFMTGLYPAQTGVLNNQTNFRERQPGVLTLPQLFQEHGYFVARVGKIFHYGVPLQIGTSGLDDPESWQQVYNPIGIDRTELDRVRTIEPGKYGGTLSWLNIRSSDLEHTDGIGASAAIMLMKEHHPVKTGKPFFLAVGFYRPHTPYVAPSHYFDLYPRERIDPVLEKPGDRDDIPVAALADRPKQRELSISQRKEIIQAYYASTSLMDAQVGRLLGALDQLELTDSTVILFVSDHGYHLGNHGLWQKGDLFEGSARVPLLIASPGVSGGKATGAITEMTDIFPTIAELCGIPLPPHLQGQSLVPILENQTKTNKETALTVAWSRAGWLHPEVRGKQIMGHSIRTTRFRYTEWGEGEFGTELYDYDTDPGEYTNLSGDPSQAAILTKMKQLLDKALNRASAPAH
jgi:arylsulfatase A-like enzyme